MQLPARKPAKALLWLLALLVPAQPVFALDCSCNCQAVRDNACDEASNRSGPPSLRQGASKPCRCCQSQQTSSAGRKVAIAEQSSPWPALVSCGIRPCQCPVDCDCHFRHDFCAGITETEKAQSHCELVAPVFVGTIVDGAFAATGTMTSLSLRHSAHERTALEICAHLCRFVV